MGMDYRAILVSQMQPEHMKLADGLFELGPFTKDECHYLNPSPWPEVGSCDDCVFFAESADEEHSGCMLVEGDINPEGLCRFYVIPGEDDNETEDESAAWMKKKPKKNRTAY